MADKVHQASYKRQKLIPRLSLFPLPIQAKTNSCHPPFFSFFFISFLKNLLKGFILSLSKTAHRTLVTTLTTVNTIIASIKPPYLLNCLLKIYYFISASSINVLTPFCILPYWSSKLSIGKAPLISYLLLSAAIITL